MGNLMLKRARGETVTMTTGMGERIVVTVLECWRNAVELSFKAPISVNIVRSELADPICPRCGAIDRFSVINDVGQGTSRRWTVACRCGRTFKVAGEPRDQPAHLSEVQAGRSSPAGRANELRFSRDHYEQDVDGS